MLIYIGIRDKTRNDRFEKMQHVGDSPLQVMNNVFECIHMTNRWVMYV